MASQPDLQGKPKFKGDILLCEDSAINQYVAKSLLTKLGFDVSVASNGQEGVDAVLSRVENAEQPFGLIFMDIYMPVMGGFEAVKELRKHGSGVPVVALTSNIEAGDIEAYLASGMKDYLKKPIEEKELWECLLKYFTPVGFFSDSEKESSKEKEESRIRLITGFVKRNRTTYEDIRAALDAGDVKLAHRLAHTLRGLAGLLGKNGLQEAARKVELSLVGGSSENVGVLLPALRRELMAVIEELLPLVEEATKSKTIAEINIDKANALYVFERLEKALLDDSARCTDFIGDLRSIEGTGPLIEQVEEYEFERALEILSGLKKALGVSR